MGLRNFLFGKPVGNLLPFDDNMLRIEYIEGNQLKITYLQDCYVTAGETLTLDLSYTVKLTPGVVYNRKPI